MPANIYIIRLLNTGFLLFRIAVQTLSNILLVKTSSLGDVLHNLPVVTDILKRYPAIQIDWVVEESFASLPALHHGVHEVIPVAIRRWRKSWWSSRGEFRGVCRNMGVRQYDIALDTQGLLKSALIARCAQTTRCGFAWDSAREPLASLFYNRRFSVAKDQHAVERNRQLAGLALGYKPEGAADYGIRPPAITHPDWLTNGAYAVLLHATSRSDKLWSEANWIALGRYLHEKNIRCVLPWGSEAEQARSLRLAGAIPDAITPPRLNLNDAASLLGGAQVVIGVDTGLAHLAAALNVPTVGIYTMTDPALTGLYAGRRAVNLGNINCTPDVAAVIGALQQAMSC
ncbi:MAG: lipopolysaccharide heptosyltransferase I [Nitrosomonadales bacterium]|nr:lipopolysaccharide heptosyltransferase I [Nitrosomonadales bacterium]